MRKWLYSAYIYLFIITLLGILLRWKMIEPILPGLQYMHLVHAHSHVAFLGWVYFLINAVIIQHCFPKGFSKKQSMRIYYYLLHVSVLGMLISFSCQGYGPFSIAFSTLHAFLSYFLAFQFFSQRNNQWPWYAKTFYQAAICFNLLSSLGPWGLAIAGATGIGNEDINNFFIYYYLHLQYNGWFTFIILGMCYRFVLMEKPAQRSWAKWQFILLTISVVPSYLSSSLWFIDHPIAVGLGITGSILQFISISIFLILVSPSLWRRQNGVSLRMLLGLSLVSLVVKSLLELLSAWPTLAYAIFESRQVIIGYLHLTLLGFITSYLLFFTGKEFTLKKLSIPPVALYLTGTAGMIFLLFFAGLFQWLRWAMPPSIWLALLVTGVLSGCGIVGIFWDIHRGFRQGSTSP